MPRIHTGVTQLYISLSKKGCFFLPHLLVILVTHADIYGLIRFLNVLLYNKVKATCLFFSFCVFFWAPPRRPYPGGVNTPPASGFDPIWEVFCKQKRTLPISIWDFIYVKMPGIFSGLCGPKKRDPVRMITLLGSKRE
uniref:Uncharacterized protein n=1 Tax=Phlegmariurus squarrosus TaxID=73615 RepID=H9M8A5_PHLSQ|nr:hypothetical protein HusqMp149 [Phlegmariurus squarrosus]AEV55812.1 hypothetical protein HusqMp149 [Phlegmariurus squarrosus]